MYIKNAWPVCLLCKKIITLSRKISLKVFERGNDFRLFKEKRATVSSKKSTVKYKGDKIKKPIPLHCYKLDSAVEWHTSIFITRMFRMRYENSKLKNAEF